MPWLVSSTTSLLFSFDIVDLVTDSHLEFFLAPGTAENALDSRMLQKEGSQVHNAPGNSGVLYGDLLSYPRSACYPDDR